MNKCHLVTVSIRGGLSPGLGMLRVDPGHSNYLGIYYDPGQTRSIPRAKAFFSNEPSLGLTHPYWRNHLVLEWDSD